MRSDELTTEEGLLALLDRGETSAVLTQLRPVMPLLGMQACLYCEALLYEKKQGELAEYLRGVEGKVEENPLHKACWLLFSGYLSQSTNRWELALQKYQEALALLANEKSRLVRILTGLVGSVNYWLGNYEICEEQLLEALNSFPDNNDLFWRAFVLDHVGILAYHRGFLKKALHNFFLSYNLYETLGHTNNLMILLNNIALVYNRLNNYEKATKYGDKAFQLAINDLETDEPKIEVTDLKILLYNLGMNNFFKGDLMEARSFFEKVLESRSRNGHENWAPPEVLAAIELGRVEVLLGNLNVGLNLIQKVGVLVNESREERQLFRLNLALGFFYLEGGRLDNAQEALEVCLLHKNAQIDREWQALAVTYLSKVQKMKGTLGPTTIIDFPLPPYSSPAMEAAKVLVGSMVHHANLNLNQAREGYYSVLGSSVPYELKLVAWEELATVSFQDWLINQTETSYGRLKKVVEKLEILAKEQGIQRLAVAQILQKARVAVVDYDIKLAELLVEEAALLAKQQGFNREYSMTQKLIRSVREKQNRVSRSIPRPSSSPNSPPKPPEPPHNVGQMLLDERVSDPRQMGQDYQKKVILEIVKEHPLGVLQKDLPGLTGLSKATISRRIAELEKMGLVEKHQKGRTLLVEMVWSNNRRDALDGEELLVP